MSSILCLGGPLHGQEADISAHLVVAGTTVDLPVPADVAPYFIGKKMLFRGPTTAEYIIRKVMVGDVKRWCALHAGS